MLHFRVERSAARAHDTDSAAEDFSHRSKDQGIVDPVFQQSVVLEVPLLGRNGILNDAFQRPLKLLNPVVHFLMDLVVEGGERAKERWLQALHIFEQTVRPFAAVTNSEAIHDRVGVRDLLVNVGKRHVGQVHIVLGEVEADVVGSHLA